MSTSTIRAIDTGYGNTKFTIFNHQENCIDYGLFPSIAPLASTTDLSGGVITRRNTVVVSVDKAKYEVGPDADLARHTHSSRILHKQFTNSPEYRALTTGAMFYMGEPHIDQLVIGLPVSLLETKGHQLKHLFEGTHHFLNNSSTTVDEVIVLAQPLGGFFQYSLSNKKYNCLRDSINLVIDPGYFTVDWVLARGIQPINQRCGTFAGGMYALLHHLAQSISRFENITYQNVEAIDKALHTGSLAICGKKVSLSQHIQDLKPVIDEAINAVVNSVGDGSDIDNIIVCGGAAPFFTSAIAEQFPSHSIQTLPNAVFANVAGFQQAGEYLSKHNQEARA